MDFTEIEKIKYILPNRRVGKTNKDNRAARLIDINDVVEQVNKSLTEINNNIPIVEPTLYKEVNFNSSQILNSGTSSMELLPDASAGKYYTGYIDFEFTSDVQYDVGDETGFFIMYVGPVLEVHRIIGMVSISTILGTSAVFRVDLNSFQVDSSSLLGEIASVTKGTAYSNSAIKLQSYLGDVTNIQNPTNGTGTLKAKITYKEETFG